MMPFVQGDTIFDKISKGFEDSLGGPVAIIVLGLVALAIIVGIAFLIRNGLREYAKAPVHSKVFFRQLCRDHALARPEVRALKKMAAAYEISDPAMLFLRRSLFESGAGAIKLDSATKKSITDKLFTE